MLKYTMTPSSELLDRLLDTTENLNQLIADAQDQYLNLREFRAQLKELEDLREDLLVNP
jgi:phage shock protein A